VKQLVPNRSSDIGDRPFQDQIQQQQDQRLRQQQQRQSLQDLREMQAQAQQIQLGRPIPRTPARF
jgi:hypothetical protein